MKILQIDDNDDIRTFVELAVTSMGHEFKSVNNGKQGVEMITTNQYDMVLLDLSMPDFSGIDVIDDLVEKKLINKQRVVVFSASSNDANQIQELIDKGVHSFLPKPVDLDELMDKITTMESEINQ